MADAIKRVRLRFTTEGAKRAEKETRAVEKATVDLGLAWTEANQALELMAKGLTLVGGTFRAMAQGGLISDVDAAFKSMGGSATLLAEAEERLAGTVSRNLIKQFHNKSVALGLTSEQYVELVEVAKAAAQQLGIDMPLAIESVVNGVTKLEKEWLDNIGIAFKAEEAYKNYADANGLVADKLTAAQQTQAFYNETLIRGRKIMESMPANSLANDFQRASAQAENLGDAVKVLGAKAAVGSGFLEDLTDLAEAFTLLFEDRPIEFVRLDQIQSIAEARRELALLRDEGATIEAITRKAQLDQLIKDLTQGEEILGKTRLEATKDFTGALDDAAEAARGLWVDTFDPMKAYQQGIIDSMTLTERFASTARVTTSSVQEMWRNILFAIDQAKKAAKKFPKRKKREREDPDLIPDALDILVEESNREDVEEDFKRRREQRIRLDAERKRFEQAVNQGQEELKELRRQRRSVGAAAFQDQGIFGAIGLGEEVGAEDKLKGFSDALLEFADTSANVSRIVSDAFGMMSQSIGQSLAQAVIVGDFSGKALKKAIANTLAGLSAKAFGESIYLSGLAVASASLPGLGPAVSGAIATSAATMGATGLVLAGMARALGAGETTGATAAATGTRTGGGVSPSRSDFGASQESRTVETTILVNLSGRQIHQEVIRQNGDAPRGSPRFVTTSRAAA